ncbi:MAG: CBS domain-containing protein [Desulfopila sp.]|jgi:nanoRNase/pAp phosphatase (c-di-AMP/oligoRNAs hydrolase)|nr:CBS domain-containing protein [Desulfopila sp.]
MKIVTTHKNTDFDALASVIAATILYPGATGVVPKMVNKNVERFLSTHKTAFNVVLPHEIDAEEVETLVVVDTNCWKRLDRMEKLRDRTDLTVHLWDHHMQEGDIHPHWHCVENTGAAVTLLIRELHRRKIELTPLDSTIMLIGLYEDTGHLTYPGTTPEDAVAAAYLLKNGADLNVAAFFLNPPYEEVQKDILFDLIENTEKFTHNKVTVGINIVRLDKKISMLATIVNMYRKLINADAVFVIFINSDVSCTAIARSSSSRIDAGAIMRRFGGGGHPRAASASIRTEQQSPEQIKQKIIQIIKESKVNTATVADLMSYPVTMVAPETSMKEVRDIMEERGIRGVLVGSEEHLEGIIVLWDFKKIRQERQWQSPVKAFMVRNVTSIPPDIDPTEAAQLMIRKNIGHLPVEYQGKIIGILTRTDILTYVYDMLPE